LCSDSTEKKVMDREINDPALRTGRYLAFLSV